MIAFIDYINWTEQGIGINEDYYQVPENSWSHSLGLLI